MVQLPLEMEEAKLAVMVWLDRDLPMSKGALRWDFPIALSACRDARSDGCWGRSW